MRLRVHVTTQQHEIDGAAQVDHLVRGVITLLAGRGHGIFFRDILVAGGRRVNQQRYHAAAGHDQRFLQELIFVGQR